MPLAWPAATFEAVLSWSGSVGTQWKNVWKFAHTTPGSYAFFTDANALWTAIETEVAALLALMNHTVTLETVQFNDLTSPDLVIKNVNSPGSKSGDPLPPQTCCLFMLKAGSGDASRLGRTYIGGLSESDQSMSAAPDNAFLASISDKMDDILAAAAATDTPWVVASFQETIARPIQAITPINRWRTQRRRAY